MDFVIAPGSDLLTALEEAMAHYDESDENRLTIVLDPDSPPDRAMVEILIRHLDARRALRELTLVHPNALIGFLVSSVSLQCPWTLVRSARSL